MRLFDDCSKGPILKYIEDCIRHDTLLELCEESAQSANTVESFLDGKSKMDRILALIDCIGELLWDNFMDASPIVTSTKANLNAVELAKKKDWTTITGSQEL